MEPFPVSCRATSSPNFLLCLIPLNLTQLQDYPQLQQCNEKYWRYCVLHRIHRIQNKRRSSAQIVRKARRPVNLPCFLFFSRSLFLLLVLLSFFFLQLSPKSSPKSTAVCSHYPSAIFVVCLFKFVIRQKRLTYNVCVSMCLEIIH